jgi:vesicle-fusing ATPase
MRSLAHPTAALQAFNDAYKSSLSMIILDDLERLLEYVPVGPRFSNTVLQTLLVLVKALPPAGRRLLVVATTAREANLEELDLMKAFNLKLGVPELEERDQYARVLRELGTIAEADVDAIAESLDGCTMGIKRLLAMVESAQQDALGTRSESSLTPDGKVTKERFAEVQLEWHS